MTNEDLAQHLMDLKGDVASTKATVETYIRSATERQDRQDQRLNSHGDRLHAVEKGSWYRTGAFATAAAVGVWALNKLGMHVS